MLSCTYAEARKARVLHNRTRLPHYQADVQDLGDGWTFIGSGHSRHAYLSPRGVVYKVGWERNNEGEHEAAVLMRQFDHPLVGIPETHYYPTLGVLAMQHITGQPGIPQKEKHKYQQAIDKYGAIDFWYLNFIFDGAKVWLIDLGQFCNKAERRSLVAELKRNHKPASKPKLVKVKA